MVLFVDRHRPKRLDATDYHKPLANRLKKLVHAHDFPHMLVYGPSGAGKKTRIMALLRELHGPAVERLKVEARDFKFGTTNVELTVLSSPHHIELNPSDAGNKDREVVGELIKEIASTAPVLGGGAEVSHAFKVVVLNEVERLSKPAQHALRRTMEKYVNTCRLLLCCTNPSKVIAPIRSRCLCVRVAAPTHNEVAAVLSTIATKENLKLPPALALRISHECERNLRRAILTLEACKVQSYPFSEDQPLQLPDWQLFIDGLAREIQTEQSPRQLLKVRGKLYELIASCIPPEVIMKRLCAALLKRAPLPVQHEVSFHAASYDHRLHGGQKAIFHLEAFIARYMAIHKKHTVQMAR
jgi:replication factor C subunit 3/5